MVPKTAQEQVLDLSARVSECADKCQASSVLQGHTALCFFNASCICCHNKYMQAVDRRCW